MKPVASALVLAAVAAACVNPGETPYIKRDFESPTLYELSPRMGGDAGVPILTPAQFITITFTEPMDLDSLRPGIVVRNKDRKEQPLTIQVDPDQIPVPNTRSADPGNQENPKPFAVRISSAEPSGFASGGYQLILRTLLLDTEGNSLNGEFLGAFYVQF